MFRPGVRVVRGPNWFWDNQDGGEGYVGTVYQVHTPESKDTVVVQWDNGNRTNCRAGYMGKYDLRVIDNAQIGVQHTGVLCDECGAADLRGLRYKCNACHDYDLCCQCYHGDKHDLSHSFRRIDFPKKQGVNLPPRSTFTKYELKGIFVGAHVVRGYDWEWSDQDGGAGKTGVVVDIRDWHEKSARSTACVQWAHANRDLYRIGHKGHCDIKFVEAASGGFYYPQHLPVLGQNDEQMEVNLIIDFLEIQQVREFENNEATIKKQNRDEWKEVIDSALAKLPSTQSSYAEIIMRHSRTINQDRQPMKLIYEVRKNADAEIDEMWRIIKCMSRLPAVLHSSDVLNIKYTYTFTEALLKQGKRYLENSLRCQLLEIVDDISSPVDSLATYDIVHKFVGMRFLDYTGLQDGLIADRPLWPMVYYCLRLGDLPAAIYCLKESVLKFEAIVAILEAKANSANSPLIATLEEKLRRQPLSRDDTDPFKRIVWAILTCQDEISEVIRTLDDYIWMKLNLVRVDYEGECLKYEDLQYTILEEQGESHYKAFANPLRYFKLLALTGQLEAAVEFLFRTDKFKVHGVHMAIALNDINLLTLPVDSTSPLLSVDVDDPKPGRRLNFTLLIKSYVSNFDADCVLVPLHYFFLLRNLTNAEQESIFDVCVYDFIFNTKQYAKILGTFHKNALKTKGLIEQFKNTKVSAKSAANRLVKKDLYEDALDLYAAVNYQEGVLHLMCALLSKVVHLESKDALRSRVETKADFFNELFSKEGYDGSDPRVVNSFFKLRGLLKFFNLYRNKEYAQALKTLVDLKIVPLRLEELNERFEKMKNFTSDFYKVVPDVLLATMTILLAQCDKIRKAYGEDINSRVFLEQHLRCVWGQANSITNFTEKLPSKITKNVNIRVIQMEVLMHS